MSLAGKLLYRFWYLPVSTVKDSIRRGGPVNQWRVRHGQKQMQAAAAMLPPVTSPDSSQPPLHVHLLSGRKFAYQTVFCLHTLAHWIQRPLVPEIYDDGTLAGPAADLLREKFTNAILHPHQTLVDRLEQKLPLAQFPCLRERWLNYPHIRKLIDVHLPGNGWRLVLDSDLLFWRHPRLLVDWLDDPQRPLHAVDIEENYGYPRELLTKIAGRPVPTCVNVGLMGLNSGEIDWDFLEQASARLIREQGTSYYLEQALSALIVARSPHPAEVAPREDYLVLPDAAEVAKPTAVMHHYVDLSRDLYHTQAWQQAASIAHA